MSATYLDAPATKLLATHCVVCGRSLLDATSVQLGIGPECRDGYDGGISEEVRVAANKLVFSASLAASAGEITKVKELAAQINALGLETLAEKVGRRFVNAERNVDIEITVVGETMKVKTPYRRGAAEEFILAWREIPGRRWNRDQNCNEVPVTQKAALWALLCKFFPGKYGKGTKGLFRVPAAKE
jgi:hypothetical protein